MLDLLWFVPAVVVGVYVVLVYLDTLRHNRINDQTTNERIRIIFAIQTKDNWEELSGLFVNVKREDHLKALLKRKDPMKLYDYRIQELMKTYEV